MELIPHSASDYKSAMLALLPPGQAWQWPDGGLGSEILGGTAEEPVRLDDAVRQVLDIAIETHRPAPSNWRLESYRRIAASAIKGVVEAFPRKPFAVGSRVGDRCWSAAAPAEDFKVDLVRVLDMPRPLRVGSRVGDKAWGHRSRYIMRVQYYKSVVDPKPVWDALNAFRQAHVYLWFEDITGVEGAFYG